MKGKEYYSHYEKVRIISARALQISQGAPLLVKAPKDMTIPLELSKMEWENEVIPMDTRRRVE